MIDSMLFSKLYKQLQYVTVKRASGRAYPPDTFSFDSGFWKDEEGYKKDCWAKAREAMMLDSWPEHKEDIDYILQHAAKAFFVPMNEKREQNLVSEQNYNRFIKGIVYKSDIKIKKEAASILYSIYYEDNNEVNFNRFASLVIKFPDPISVVSYFFFLKEKRENDYQFVPARKNGTGARLGLLNQDKSCVTNCSWEGYQKYIAIVREIQVKLKPYHPDATLLDAQSFLWMLWMINKKTPEYLEVPDDELIKINQEEDEKLVLEISNSFEDDPLSDPEYIEGPVPRSEPETINNRNIYPRKQKVSRRALAISGYRCEIDEKDPTFIRKSTGKPYVEPHHLIPMAYQNQFEVSLDREQNIVSLCSNCHNEIHYGKEADKLIEKLYDKRKELLESIGITVTLEQLKKMYE